MLCSTLLIPLCSLLKKFLTTVTFYPIIKHLTQSCQHCLHHVFIHLLIYFCHLGLCCHLKVSSIVQETMPATQFTKCCHVDLNCLQKRKWFMQICLFSAFVNQFFFTCTLLRVNRCNSKNSHLSFREQS